MARTQLSGQVLDEKYRIEGQLGEGGMGDVYFATHLGTGRPVALKVIAPQFMKQEEFVERFKREARAAGRLRHPNVVDVTDFGFARVGPERVAYLVMEYLDGCTLADVLAEERRLPLGFVLDIMEQTCSALDEAHQQGIIHRDLKPDNIWLEPNRRGGYTVKVLDFGIAKLADAGLPSSPATEQVQLSESATVLQPPAMASVARASADERAEEAATIALPSDADDAEGHTLLMTHRTTDGRGAPSTADSESLTRVGSILGTPLYMSPEQCLGQGSDARSDIYSLGVIAYQMLSGETPFKGTPSTIMRQHIEEQPQPFTVKRVPQKIIKLIMSALAKSPQERPATAAAFANSLRAHSEGAGALMRRALTLFSEQMPTFLRLALIIYSPLIVVNLLEAVNSVAHARRYLPSLLSAVLSAVLALLSTLCALVTTSINIGVTTRLVTQLMAAPLRPLEIGPAFRALRARLVPFLLTTGLVSLGTLIGVFLGLIPGLMIMVNYSLVTPVMMMEEKRGRAALRRAKELSRRSRRTVVTVVFIQLFAPILASIGIALLISAVIKALELTGSRAGIFGSIYQIVFLPISIIIGALSSLLTALLYLKMRQAGGETLREALVQFEADELPRRNWQLRMRERLHLPNRPTRSTG